METENKELLAGYWQKALIVLGALLIILGLCSGFLLSIKGSGLPFCICMAGFEYLRIALDNSQFHSFIDKSFRKKWILILIVPIVWWVIYAIGLSDYSWSCRLYLLGAVFAVLIIAVVYKNLRHKH